MCVCVFKRIFYYNFFWLFLGSVPDPMTSCYTTATLPQYASGLYAPASLPSNAISTVASVVAGKQIEGRSDPLSLSPLPPHKNG